jgi:putative FmdB family regulatory protein
MPIYEYKCKKCGSEFEVFQKISEADAKSCKFCHGPVNKLMSLSSFQLQGSGWYVTDYAGKKPNVKDEKPGGSEDKKDTVAADVKQSSTDSKATPAASTATATATASAKAVVKDSKAKAA